MTLQFEQTVPDYVDFSFYTLWEAEDKKWSRLLTRFLPLAIILFVVLINVKNLPYFFSTAVVFVVIGILCAVFGPRVIFLGNRLRVRKMLADPANGELLGQRTLTFGPEVLTIATPYSTAVVNFTAFRQVTETQAYFYLFLGVNQPIIVPKSAFESQEQIVELRALLKR
jgi:hypothetical protein